MLSDILRYDMAFLTFQPKKHYSNSMFKYNCAILYLNTNTSARYSQISIKNHLLIYI